MVEGVLLFLCSELTAFPEGAQGKNRTPVCLLSHAWSAVLQDTHMFMNLCLCLPPF